MQFCKIEKLPNWKNFWLLFHQITLDSDKPFPAYRFLNSGKLEFRKILPVFPDNVPLSPFQFLLGVFCFWELIDKLHKKPGFSDTGFPHDSYDLP